MNIQYTTPNGRLVFKFDCKGAKEAFDHVATVQSIFEHEKCGACGDTSIACNVREPQKGQRYFELVCQSCNARLDVHQNLDNVGLYITRKDKNGQIKGVNGWYIWTGQSDNPNQSSNQGHSNQNNQSATWTDAGFKTLLARKGLSWPDALRMIDQADGTHFSGVAENISQLHPQAVNGFATYVGGLPDKPQAQGYGAAKSYGAPANAPANAEEDNSIPF